MENNGVRRKQVVIREVSGMGRDLDPSPQTHGITEWFVLEGALGRS